MTKDELMKKGIEAMSGATKHMLPFEVADEIIDIVQSRGSDSRSAVVIILVKYLGEAMKDVDQSRKLVKELFAQYKEAKKPNE